MDYVELILKDIPNCFVDLKKLSVFKLLIFNSFEILKKTTPHSFFCSFFHTSHFYNLLLQSSEPSHRGVLLILKTDALPIVA